MILTSFKYREKDWELSEIVPLGIVNLLVGRNATGKTRTIKAIYDVTSFLQMKGVAVPKSFESSLSFKYADSGLTYSFKIDDGVVVKENLIVNGEIIIKRSKSSAKYRVETINPPDDKLIVQIRRDRKLYPEIENIISWAEGVTYVSCSDINPYTVLGTGKFLNPYSFSELVEKLSSKDKKQVLSNAGKLGFAITELGTIDTGSDLHLVQLKEKGITSRMIDMQLSSGMMRTLYLLCFMAAVKHDNRLSLLLIDDMSEGLDYRRSIDLGKLIFDDCKSQDFQLITSSNDAFLMDIVDISEWQVLRRDKNKVSVINKASHPELFRQFQMTGLSNFDLFSSDFIDNYLNK